MFVSRIYRGLCATCGNTVICTYAKEADQPVTACEEFDGYAMTRPIACGGYLSPLAKSWVRSEEECYSGEDGLCGTCGARRSCAGEPGKSSCADYR
ncbi:MAG: hypothetical protein LAP85_18295 [Acidobacteriia bacterium]|nr:hypothetical protein [Terriglobia bacterium]